MPGSEQKAEEAVARLRTALDALKAFKGDPLMERGQLLLSGAAEALEDRRFRAASGLAEEGMGPVREMRRLQREAADMADRLASRIRSCTRLGIDVERARLALEKGRAELKRDHHEAIAHLMRGSVELIGAGTKRLRSKR